MPVRKAVIDCLCLLLFFFIKRVIFETADSTLAPNMAGRRAWLPVAGKELSVSFTDIRPGVFPGGPKN